MRKNQEIYIVGGGGFASKVLNLLQSMSLSVIGFIDEGQHNTKDNLPVFAFARLQNEQLAENTIFIIAMSSPEYQQKARERILRFGVIETKVLVISEPKDITEFKKYFEQGFPVVDCLYMGALKDSEKLKIDIVWSAASSMSSAERSLLLINERASLAEIRGNWEEAIKCLDALLTSLLKIPVEEEFRIVSTYLRLIKAFTANHQYDEAENMASRLIELEEYPKVATNGFARFVSWNSELGWAPLANTRKLYNLPNENREFYFSTDEKGARISWPYYTNKHLTISAYGDSYCMGYDVNDEETWPWYFGEMNDCYVSNYGVGNYGLDQALLRLERNFDNDPTDVVILAVTSNTCERLPSIFKHYIEDGNTLGVKPRFYLKDGQLQIFKNPLKEKEDLLTLWKFKEIIRKHDEHYGYWYSKQLHRLLPWKEKPMDSIAYMNYCWTQYKDLFLALIKRFEQFAFEKKFKPVFLLFHNFEQIVLFDNSNASWIPVLNEVKQLFPSITVVDSIYWFYNYASLDQLYTQKNANGHPTPLANRLIASRLTNEI